MLPRCASCCHAAVFPVLCSCAVCCALQEAIDLDGKNPLARYERAAVLAAQDRPAEALAELTALRAIAPGEASVLFQMGKLYKKVDGRCGLLG